MVKEMPKLWRNNVKTMRNIMAKNERDIGKRNRQNNGKIAIVWRNKSWNNGKTMGL